MLASFLLGCDPPAAAPPTAQGSKQSDVVTLIKPERRTIRHAIEQPGTIEAFEQTPLFAKIAGYVKEMRVDIGDAVKAGDVLAELSVPEMDEELTEKEVRVEQVRAEIKQAEAALAEADAGLKTAAAKIKEAEAGRSRADAMVLFWKSQLQRLEPTTTIEKQVVEETRYQLRASEAAREEVEAKIQSAQATRDESVAKRAKAEADVHAVTARLGVAQAEQRRVAALVGYAKIRAPFAGVVTRRTVDTGAFLQPAPGGKAEPLLVVMRADKVRIVVDVPETAAPYVGKETAARVRIQALGGREFKGMVTRTSWALDPKARQLRAAIDLPNSAGNLRPGMYAYATLGLERDKALSLPATAIAAQGDQLFCYRLENGKAVRTPIQAGLRGGEFVEVLRKQTKPAKDGEATWEDFTGAEAIVAAPASVTDGQDVIAK